MMKKLSDIPFSVLDLSPINQGSTAAESLRHSLSLAQHTERLGYHRYWLAEHHNMTGIASAATSVVIGYIADTKTLVDLTGVTFIDGGGKQLLTRMHAQGARLIAIGIMTKQIVDEVEKAEPGKQHG